MPTYMYACIHTHACMHACLHTLMDTHIRTTPYSIPGGGLNLGLTRDACMYAYMHAFTRSSLHSTYRFRVRVNPILGVNPPHVEN